MLRHAELLLLNKNVTNVFETFKWYEKYNTRISDEYS